MTNPKSMAPTVENPSAAKTNDRVRKMRNLRSASGLNRWEIYSSDALKEKVRHIAKSEGTSVSDTAAALLAFGMEQYQSIVHPKMGDAFRKPPGKGEKGWLMKYSYNMTQGS